MKHRHLKLILLIMLLIAPFSSLASSRLFNVGDCVKPRGMDYWESGFQLVVEVGQYSYRTEAYTEYGFLLGSTPASIHFGDEERQKEKFSCPRKKKRSQSLRS